MAYLALYRKYRPCDFNGVIGQDHIVKTLINQIESDGVGHAYLFTGTRGTGKTSIAKIFAKAINCEHPVNGSPCGKCPTCMALSDPSNIDVVEIDAASNNGVNEIRDLREKVQYPPVSCKRKVYIIDEVHMLSGAAFNALLKTLEEPPKHVVFILATTEVYKIPATILSRCMRFDFKLVPTETIAKLIEDIYTRQNKSFEKEAVFAIAKAGEGSVRDALSIADTAMSYKSGTLTYDDVSEVLGTSNETVLIGLVNEIISGNTGKVLEYVDGLCSAGKSIGVLIKDVCAMLRDLLIIVTCSEPNKILNYPDSKYSAYKVLGSKTNEDRLLRALEVFSEAENNLRFTNNPRIVFETAAVKVARPEFDVNVDALMARLKQVEDKIDGLSKNRVQKVTDAAVETNNETATTTNSVVLSTENARLKISEVSSDELKGKLLYNVRNNGSEMLWNLLQGVEMKANGNVLYLYVKSVGDEDILKMPVNTAKIKEAALEYAPFEIEIKRNAAQVKRDQMDDAAEKIKKIFGDDIVIIKE